MTASTQTFTLTIDDDIGIISIDMPGSSVNTLRAEFAEELHQLLQQLDRDSHLRGVILRSAKPGCFVAGADIHMIAACASTNEATTLAHSGQTIFRELEQYSLPIVAVIEGTCLGGGLELAMACHGRVASNDPATRLGLPEVKLGLLPGSGGTQRLPRLVGIRQALTLMLTGKTLSAQQAYKSGLVDDCVPSSILMEVAKQRLTLLPARKPRKPKLKGWGKWLENNPLGRKLLFKLVRKQTLAQTKGNYPAPLSIIDVVEHGSRHGWMAGETLEAERFGQLAMTPESFQLRQLFFATTEMKKEAESETGHADDVQQLMVLGGGLMGAGIAYVSAHNAKRSVYIKDISQQQVSHALRNVYQLLSKRVARRRLTRQAREQVMQRVLGGTSYARLGQVDLVIEAVVEDLALKQRMVHDIEQHATDKTIFASNTSSLPIARIAEHAAHPERVVGLHYFSPVDKMPLVEIIAHPGTSENTIATVLRVARAQGKTAIVVKDGPGFYVNRILAAYMNEAAYLLTDGEPISSIDKALQSFGFPVGPFKLLDEVGIDIGAKIMPILEQGLGDRFTPPRLFELLLADERRGKKSQRGFYHYGRSIRRRERVDDNVYRLLSLTPEVNLERQEIVRRCVYPMLNEAARCLEENVVRNARDGDIGAVMGIGFPPFLGGPFRYMDALGLDNVVQTLNAFAQQIGPRYRPCTLLLDMAEQRRCFYEHGDASAE